MLKALMVIMCFNYSLRFSTGEQIISNQSRIEVLKGDSFVILCTTLKIVKGCYIKTPKNELRIFFTGASYENSRMQKYGNDEDHQCGAQIYNASVDVDNGTWECGISISENDRSILITKPISVSIVSPPDHVEIRVQQHSESSGLKRMKIDANKHVILECVAYHASPRPTFSWFLGKHLVNTTNIPCNYPANKRHPVDFVTNYYGDTEQEKSEATITGCDKISAPSIESHRPNLLDQNVNANIQKFAYQPSLYHNGKQLKCVVTHKKYSKPSYASNLIELDIWYPPKILKERIYHYRDKILAVYISFKSNPKPLNVYWTLSNGVRIGVGEMWGNNKYVSRNISLISSAIPDEWSVELLINLDGVDTYEVTGAVVIQNNMNNSSHPFEISTNNREWSPMVLISMGFAGILLTITLVAIGTLIVIQKVQDKPSHTESPDK